MLIAQYETRLPADHDMNALRSWLAERGGVWDGTPDLHFKAILTREIGHHGAKANSWSSLYLWQHEDAFRRWLVRGGYEVVTDRYGRADIETFTALEAKRGSSGDPRMLYRTDVPIRADSDLTATLDDAISEVNLRAGDPDVVVACVGLDPRRWVLRHVTITERASDAHESAEAFQVAYLARSLLEDLPAR